MFPIYLLIFVFGLAAGSFVNTCIYRIPSGKSVIRHSSACLSCGRKLTLHDIVPVFSYIVLKGRCRYCGERISPRYLLVELLTAAVFLSLFVKYGFSVAFFAFCYIMAVLLAVFFIDADHRIIPDELVIAGLIGGIPLFVYNVFRPMTYIYGDDMWWTPVAGMFSSSGILFLIALIGGLIYKSDDVMGMGDVKIMAPLGLFLGWRLCLQALFISIILAGITSLFLVLFRRKKRNDTIPLGPFIVTGTYLTVMWGWDILEWYTIFSVL